MKIKWIVWGALAVALAICPMVSNGSGKVVKTIKFGIKEVVKNCPKEKQPNIWKKERKQIQKEVCELFKDLILKRKINYSDLDKISAFIRQRLPKGHRPKKYPTKTEQVGRELIDDHLTIVDYEAIKDWLLTVWKAFGVYGKQSLKGYPTPINLMRRL